MNKRDMDRINARITREKRDIIFMVMEMYVNPFCNKHKLEFLSGGFGFYYVGGREDGARCRTKAAELLRDKLVHIEENLGCDLDDYEPAVKP